MAADIQAQIDGVKTSTQALEHTVATLTDEQARGPSLLPGWSRGHVLTHIARNADALVNLVTWARTGVKTPMYPSRDERNAVIEAQSGRAADELRTDIHASHERLMAAMAELDDAAWNARLTMGSRDREGSATALPLMRRIEVEVHHLDLDLDYTLAHWPEDFVEALLADIAAESDSRDDMAGCVLVGNDDEGRWVIAGGGPEITGPPPALLGWLIGRSDGLGLHTASGSLPERGVWR
ncbi:MAG: maleylpyruvate isomerase family mycothiol-dependent enzyme [Propionibacteriales bacterium]|nr:maleylpyruvate isomerase family mycothiol-dependent enzyme [Propionibacteriales bacterium]